MLRRGLTAAGLVLAAVVLVAGGRAEPANTAAHVCSVLDRQFVRNAGVAAATVALTGADYRTGAITAKQAIAETRDAALGIAATAPRDPSLKLARSLIRGMYAEYVRALRAKGTGTDAGMHMYRSYDFANYAHQVLSDAAPALAEKGCSVESLL